MQIDAGSFALAIAAIIIISGHKEGSQLSGSRRNLADPSLSVKNQSMTCS
jgi:hypothetical protein